MPQLIPVTTARLGEHLPLLELLPDSAPVTWVRGGDGLVGWGSYATTTVSGPNRFNDARKWWHQQLEKLAISDSVHVSGTGPILFTSFSFDPNEESILVIPEIVVGMRNGSSWITWIGDQAQPKLAESAQMLEDAEYNWGDGSISPAEWQIRVAQAIKEIESTKLEKVVLARDLKVNSHRAIDPRKILRNLSAEYPSTWIFAVDGLIGATPELLLRLSRGMVTSRVLAGTISKTGDDERDRR
ncbi:MAG: chorismate-binding protein [Actinobacteria bacterium]|nr:chorismate-binding protein [Actinomycetota bacterium]